MESGVSTAAFPIHQSFPLDQLAHERARRCPTSARLLVHSGDELVGKADHHFRHETGVSQYCGALADRLPEGAIALRSARVTVPSSG
ncbi:MAG: hypothetical protein C4306_06425 [Thermoleophilia bacterium]